MNKTALLHKQDSKYCFPTSKNTLVLRLQVDKKDSFDKIEIIYGCKYTIYEIQERMEMKAKYVDDLFVHYEIELRLSDVRLCYVFCLWEEGLPYYYSEDGITSSYDFSISYYNSYQMPYIQESDLHEFVPWLETAVFYQIFIERFFMGDDTKDKEYINLNWGDIPNPKSFAGGDLEGIIQKLDYIKSLGINAIYLTPVFQSISNHKYDISNYYEVDSQFGSNEVFARLVEEAHKLGIHIILDAVFNHCSMLIPQFQDVLEKGKKSSYYNWFYINGDYPIPSELNYEVFAFCEYMPKLNTSNKELERYLIDIARYWIKTYDIDGWRLDVADEISHNFWRKFRQEVKEVKKDCVIIGENWHDSNMYLMGDQFDSIMNYAFTKACLDFFAFQSFDAEGFANKLNHLLTRNTNQVNHMMLNLLDTHDTDRFYTWVKKCKNKVLSAMSIMVLYPGVPCMYYGTEIFLEGGYDPDNRRCFDWNEDNWDQESIKMIKTLFLLKSSGIIGNADARIYSEDGLFYLIRWNEQYEIRLIVNQSSDVKTVKELGESYISLGFESDKVLQNGFVIYIHKKE